MQATSSQPPYSLGWTARTSTWSATPPWPSPCWAWPSVSCTLPPLAPISPSPAWWWRGHPMGWEWDPWPMFSWPHYSRRRIKALVHLLLRLVGLFPDLSKWRCRSFLHYEKIIMLFIFQAFPIVVSSLGLSGLFFICAGSSILGALFTFIFIPTTKDKSMFELEMLFAHKGWFNNYVIHF